MRDGAPAANRGPSPSLEAVEAATWNPRLVSESAKGPAECTRVRKQVIEGKPDPAYISASYTERRNLAMRMHMQRLTRLTAPPRRRPTTIRTRSR